MNVDNASNNANDRANGIADDDGAPDTADVTDTDAFEIMTQTNTFLDLDSTEPNPEQNPLAESELPPEDLLERSDPNTDN